MISRKHSVDFKTEKGLAPKILTFWVLKIVLLREGPILCHPFNKVYRNFIRWPIRALMTMMANLLFLHPLKFTLWKKKPLHRHTVHLHVQESTKLFYAWESRLIINIFLLHQIICSILRNHKLHILYTKELRDSITQSRIIHLQSTLWDLHPKSTP